MNEQTDSNKINLKLERNNLKTKEKKDNIFKEDNSL